MAVIGLISMAGLGNQLAYVETIHRGCKIKNWWLSLVDNNLVLEIEYKTRGGATRREVSVLARNVSGKCAASRKVKAESLAEARYISPRF